MIPDCNLIKICVIFKNLSGDGSERRNSVDLDCKTPANDYNCVIQLQKVVALVIDDIPKFPSVKSDRFNTLRHKTTTSSIMLIM